MIAGAVTLRVSRSRPAAAARGLALSAVVLGLVQCAPSAASSASPPGPAAAAPAAPNESALTAEVVDASVVDSATLGIAPPQPLCVLTLRLMTVTPVGAMLNTLEGRSGETIRALSRDLSLAALKGRTVALNVTLRGDERRAGYWIVGTPGAGR